MKNKKEEKYSDFSNVEAQRNFLMFEEMPEGAYGEPEGKYSPVENKSNPWHEGQRDYTPFNYEYKSLHQDLPRQYPGAHPTHDDPEQDEQFPYEDYPH